MTELLYYKDQYKTDFEAEVIECSKKENENVCEVVLDRTAFFPEQGGQYADEGTLNGVPVCNVRIKDGIIYHEVEKYFTPGEKVHGQINFAKRFDRMQNHTGEHILCGIIHKNAGLENVGFHLSDSIMTMDINGILTEKQLKEAETQANEAVFRNIKVEIMYPSEEELKNIPYRSKNEIDGQVRLVKIEGVDICACCAPHVAYTGEIGMIRIVKAVKYKGGMRLDLCCGMRALEEYRMRSEQVNMTDTLLSVKPFETFDAVKAMNDKYSELKAELKNAKKELIRAEIASYDYSDGNLCVKCPEKDSDMLREAANCGILKCGGICAAYAGDDESGYTFTMCAKDYDLARKKAEILGPLSGRGGGKGNCVSGTFGASEEEIKRFFETYRIV